MLLEVRHGLLWLSLVLTHRADDLEDLRQRDVGDELKEPIQYRHDIDKNTAKHSKCVPPKTR